MLIEAEQLRNDFVHHVSYELRSPLTNIIGFIALLGDRSVGELNEKQREYTGYILKSSAALLARALAIYLRNCGPVASNILSTLGFL